MWCGLTSGKPSVCRFKTPPCMRSRRLRVYRENARMSNTCGRFPGTHGGVLNAYTEAFSIYTRRGFPPSLSFLLSFFFLSVLLSFSLLLSSLLFSLSLFPLLSSLSSLSATMTMITRPVGLSLCTHGSDLPFGPECMYLGSLSGEHVRVVQETTVLV